MKYLNPFFWLGFIFGLIGVALYKGVIAADELMSLWSKK